MLNSIRKYALMFWSLGIIGPNLAQINNSIFYYPQSSDSKSEVVDGIKATSLQYCKNNEYAEKSNPGQTFFGQQLRLTNKTSINLNSEIKASLNLGILLQYDYGDNSFPSKFLPISCIQFVKKNNWIVNAGSLNSITNHRLQESLINWELTFTKPIEYGLQFEKTHSFFNYETWIDWRQFAKIKTSQQEIISFGQRMDVFPAGARKSGIIKIPLAALVYHQGGESLKLPKPVTTNVNLSTGISIGLPDSSLALEYHRVISKDLSQSLTHAFGDGVSHQINFKCKLSESNFIAFSYYKASQFYSPLGAPIFTSEYQGNAYNQSRNREFIMARYQYLKPLNKNLLFDLRIEPIYHLQTKLFAFSTGLYLRINLF